MSLWHLQYDQIYQCRKLSGEVPLCPQVFPYRCRCLAKTLEESGSLESEVVARNFLLHNMFTGFSDQDRRGIHVIYLNLIIETFFYFLQQTSTLTNLSLMPCDDTKQSTALWLNIQFNSNKYLFVRRRLRFQPCQTNLEKCGIDCRCSRAVGAGYSTLRATREVPNNDFCISTA